MATSFGIKRDLKLFRSLFLMLATRDSPKASLLLLCAWMGAWRNKRVIREAVRMFFMDFICLCFELKNTKNSTVCLVWLITSIDLFGFILPDAVSVLRIEIQSFIDG